MSTKAHLSPAPMQSNPRRCLPRHRLVDLAAWRTWRRSRHGRAKVLEWGLADPALLGWEPEPCLESPSSSARTDAMQAGLVKFSQSGDVDAAITLVVQLRPGLVRLVRLLMAGHDLAVDDATHEVRAVFFETLYRHSLERRPAKIAANLLLDTRSSLTKQSPSVALAGPTGQVSTSANLQDYRSTEIENESGIVAQETLRAIVAALPGSARSRKLTEQLAFRAWVLCQPTAAIAAELSLGPQVISSRLHRLRMAIQQDGSLWNTNDPHPSRPSGPGYSVTHASTK